MKVTTRDGSTKDHRRLRREMGKALGMHRRLNKRYGANETSRITASLLYRWMRNLANHPGRL